NGSGSGNDGGTTSEGGGSSSGGSNPAPAPTSDPAPAPQPTKTAAPQPTPTPTQTQPPAPKPTPPPAPPAPSRTGQAFVDMALSQVGKPYVLGAAGPNSYDCSGLVQWSLKQLGVSIPRTSRDQWWATTRVSEADLQPGDLIFYSSNGSASGIYHVAIYTGSGMRVHAPSPGKTVEHVKIWNTNIIGYGRVL
ncbi:MAG: C40 family peptidase, partial [Salana multivorans]|nr:C40 family peptidase [Salana multivorans]